MLASDEAMDVEPVKAVRLIIGFNTQFQIRACA
jgi:hypothetical protein